MYLKLSSQRGRLSSASKEKEMNTDETQAINAGPETPFVKPSYFYSRDESHELEYIVDELILAKSVVLLAGSPGAMKSFLMQELLVAIASELSFLGRHTKKTRLFYFDKENPENLWHQRLIHGFKIRVPDEFVDIWPYWRNPDPPKFLDPQYTELAKNHPGSVFIFDSYIKFLPKGYSENTNENAADVTNFLRELTAYGATIILIHHAGKDSSNGVRGAEEILAGVDVAFTLSKNDNRLTLKSIKNRFSSDSTIHIDIKTDIDGYIFFEDASEDELRQKEEKLNEQITKTCDIITSLKAQGKLTSKEAVKGNIKEVFKVGDHKAREIIQFGIDRNFLSYDKSTKALSVVVGVVTP
jgi:hypothetical protein